MVVTREHASVHILRTDEELWQAVERAAAFDRRTADILQTRSRHYSSLVKGAAEELR